MSRYVINAETVILGPDCFCCESCIAFHVLRCNSAAPLGQPKHVRVPRKQTRQSFFKIDVVVLEPGYGMKSDYQGRALLQSSNTASLTCHQSTLGSHKVFDSLRVRLSCLRDT